MIEYIPQNMSKTISMLRTILCIQIVFLHMVLTAPVPQDIDKQYFFYHELISFLTIFNNIAVPLFAAISGYLFFKKYKNNAFCYRNKIIKRIKRLIQPVFIWTSIYLILYYVAKHYQLMAAMEKEKE